MDIFSVIVTETFGYALSEEEKLNRSFMKEQIDDKNFSILGLTLERSVLSDIVLELGEGKKPTNDKWEDYNFCYISSIDKTRIVFGVHGSQLVSFKIIEHNEGLKYGGECSETSLISKETSTDSGIKLGIDMDEVKTILGKPIKDYADILVFRNEWKLNMTPSDIANLSETFKVTKDIISKDPYWDVVVSARANFKEDKLVEFEIAKGTSY